MIEIKSRSLNNYLTYKLDKLEEVYTEDELLQVDELVIDNDENLDITVLKYFKNLETLEIRNLDITNETLNIILSLNNLKDLKLQLCNIEKLKELNLKGLHLDCSNIEDYSFVYEITNLESLTLSGLKDLDIEKLNNLNNLKYLNISHTICSNDVLNIDSLEELYIDNSNIRDINFVLNLPNLKVLSLSKEQYENKKELIDKLKSKNIEILDYGIMLLGELE